MRDIQKGTKTIKSDSSQNLPESHQHDATVQRETINRPDTSLENDMLTHPTRGRQPTLLREHPLLSTVTIFDSYNVPITEFINECRRVQNAVSPQEETSV